MRKLSNFLIFKFLSVFVSTAVAKSAILSGITPINIKDFNKKEYKKVLINKHLNRIKNFYNR